MASFAGPIKHVAKRHVEIHKGSHPAGNIKHFLKVLLHFSYISFSYLHYSSDRHQFILYILLF